jgi:UDP-N-acetylglucosamine--N-acetylmuramyl-(pentapeptide) pyrophosphoryl-undecaprenol N-acetylglucosamine transferase
MIALTVEVSRSYLSGTAMTEVTGYPVRRELAAWNKADARKRLGLSQDKPVLLVFGGSRGARSINRALLAGLPDLLSAVQVLHISGTLDWAEVEAAREQMAGELQDELIDRYHAYAYMHEEMGAALAAADLVVSRAGASCLGEYPLFGLPAILVPYPYAWRYQKVNAAFLEERGAAVVIEDQALADQLVPQVRSLLEDAQRMAQMSAAMRRLARPQAAREIAGMLHSLASTGRGAE